MHDAHECAIRTEGALCPEQGDVIRDEDAVRFFFEVGLKMIANAFVPEGGTDRWAVSCWKKASSTSIMRGCVCFMQPSGRLATDIAAVALCESVLLTTAASDVSGRVLSVSMNNSTDERDVADGSASVSSVATPEVPRLSAVMANTLDELVDAVAATDRMLATVSAWRAELIDQTRQWSEVTVPATTSAGRSGWDARTIAHRTVVTELACALRLPERTVEALVSDSQALMHDLPATRDALRTGEISYRHARTLIDHASSLPEDARPSFEADVLPAAAVLPAAKMLTVAKFDRKARIARERVDTETITARHVKCVADRQVQYQPARDGMAWLSAYLPASHALGIYNRVSDGAVGLQGPNESRTLTQLRADVFADLLIDGEAVPRVCETVGGVGSDNEACRDGSARGAFGADARDDRGHAAGKVARDIRATVLVTVPVMTLLGHSEEPGMLEGYGPIDPDTARRLAANAPSFIRILTHPETGCVLSVGRSHYTVPKDLRTWLRVRDGTCRFPGCNRSAAQCDIDHTIDWQHGGATRYDNLDHLCPGHHNVKHHTDWTVENARDGTLKWTSPSGHHYVTEPAIRIQPPPF